MPGSCVNFCWDIIQKLYFLSQGICTRRKRTLDASHSYSISKNEIQSRQACAFEIPDNIFNGIECHWVFYFKISIMCGISRKAISKDNESDIRKIGVVGAAVEYNSILNKISDTDILMSVINSHIKYLSQFCNLLITNMKTLQIFRIHPFLIKDYSKFILV